ncbi:uncharacterized protein LAESUDRAFT_732867 [Laetiporus sulphureus 93-53]|uniref:Uncharacterized protein n=1 Tax=Laetiporus sulphureus 93-53 TaxID=1314785 RepID=A0A165AX05_9APHY|nr:uncharacterized protein LAESUDRAFT_732867 [Laetiporus sulphureus 93-53]KZS99814.1 hypothetical protein LAESUDRAFT_732867 [Laetiporus sulphureus 93-53]
MPGEKSLRTADIIYLPPRISPPLLTSAFSPLTCTSPSPPLSFCTGPECPPAVESTHPSLAVAMFGESSHVPSLLTNLFSGNRAACA